MIGTNAMSCTMQIPNAMCPCTVLSWWRSCNSRATIAVLDKAMLPPRNAASRRGSPQAGLPRSLPPTSADLDDATNHDDVAHPPELGRRRLRSRHEQQQRDARLRQET